MLSTNPDYIAHNGLASLYARPSLPERGFIKVNAQLQTSVPRVYAGGDCVRATGSASTVMAAQDGKIGAAAIHTLLMQPSGAVPYPKNPD